MTYKPPTIPSQINWVPEDARHALSIYEPGGPLVDPNTGRVIFLASMSNDVWTQLVELPPGANPEPIPVEPATPATAYLHAAKAAWKEAVAA